MFKHLANVIFSPIIIDFYEFLGDLVKFNTINLYKAKVFRFSGDFFFFFIFSLERYTFTTRQLKREHGKIRGTRSRKTMTTRKMTTATTARIST